MGKLSWNNKRIDVFVSYSRKNMNIVRKIVDSLDPRLFNVFFDRRVLTPGIEWERTLLDSLEKSDVLIVIVSKAALQSEYVNKEISLFLGTISQDSQKTIIPILIESGLAVPQNLSKFQWLDLTSEDIENSLGLRALNETVWGSVNIPERFAADSEDFGRKVLIPKEKQNPNIGHLYQEMWDSGEIGVSPKALGQLVNLGIVNTSTHCGHKEQDIFDFEKVKECPNEIAVQCTSCTKGRCNDPWHIMSYFCTIVPGDNPFSNGTKFFYWCDYCRGPICIRCMDLDDGYPCEIEALTSFRFQCPNCHRLVRVVTNFNASMETVADNLIKWARNQGPPLRK